MYFLKETKKLQLYKTVSVAEIEQVQKGHKKSGAPEQELFWKYHGLVFAGIPLPENMTDETFWKKLTKPQQVVFTLGLLIEQTDNGGLWQFFFNRPEYTAAAGSALDEPGGITLLGRLYRAPFEQFVELLKNETYAETVAIWNDTAQPFEKRWEAFKSGETHIPARTEFEAVFYDPREKNNLYKKLNRYIEQNIGKLMWVEIHAAPKHISKKEAVPHFTQYLTETYGTAPETVAVYYRAAVTVDNRGTELFLMHFRMPDGYESIGITGCFTHHFPDITMQHVKDMHRRFHKQQLINTYHGWYRVSKTLENNPAANRFDEAEWKELLARLQKPEKTQVPVNVRFKESFRMDDYTVYIYRGDLLYNKAETFPKDLSNVSLQETGPHYGETGLLFTTVHGEEPSFGRRSDKPAVDTTLVLYDIIGRRNKLLKDNAWGF